MASRPKDNTEGYYAITIESIYTKKDVYLKDIHLQKRIS